MLGINTRGRIALMQHEFIPNLPRKHLKGCSMREHLFAAVPKFTVSFMV
jgi:hypothetical protein